MHHRYLHLSSFYKETKTFPPIHHVCTCRQLRRIGALVRRTWEPSREENIVRAITSHLATILVVYAACIALVEDAAEDAATLVAATSSIDGKLAAVEDRDGRDHGPGPIISLPKNLRVLIVDVGEVGGAAHDRSLILVAERLNYRNRGSAVRVRHDAEAGLVFLGFAHNLLGARVWLCRINVHVVASTGSEEIAGACPIDVIQIRSCTLSVSIEAIKI
jgi:hypothetical protein